MSWEKKYFEATGVSAVDLTIEISGEEKTYLCEFTFTCDEKRTAATWDDDGDYETANHDLELISVESTCAEGEPFKITLMTAGDWFLKKIMEAAEEYALDNLEE